MMKRIKSLSTAVFAALLLGCGGNEAILKSGKSSPAPVAETTQKNGLEHDLDAMRTAGFQFIFVIKRKDGAKLDADDRSVLKKLTADANRRVVTDDELAVLIGTNTALPAENIKALSDRFAVDDHSEPAPAANSNSNVRK